MWRSTRAAGAVLVLGGLVMVTMAHRDDQTVGASSWAPTAMETLPVHDFGRIVGPERRMVELRVRNESSEAWTLRKTWSECGCVKIESASQDVSPGEDAVFTLAIDTAGQPGGSIFKQAHALYDPGPRWITLQGAAQLVSRPHTAPPLTSLEIAADESAWRVEGRINSPFDGLRAELLSAPEDVRLVFGEPSAHGLGFSLPYACDGEMSLDQANREVTLEFLVFGDPEKTQGEALSARIALARPRPLRVTPECPVIVADEAGASASAWIRRSDGTWPHDLTITVGPAGSVDASFDPQTGRIDLAAREPRDTWARAVLHVAGSGESLEFPVRVARRGDGQ
jgi:hypothetical protein